MTYTTSITAWDVMAAPIAATFPSSEGMDLVVCRRMDIAPGFDAGFAKEVMATTDGRTWLPEWETEDLDPADAVYGERWTPQGRQSQVYVHPVSRRILQTG